MGWLVRRSARAAGLLLRAVQAEAQTSAGCQPLACARYPLARFTQASGMRQKPEDAALASWTCRGGGGGGREGAEPALSRPAQSACAVGWRSTGARAAARAHHTWQPPRKAPSHCQQN